MVKRRVERRGREEWGIYKVHENYVAFAFASILDHVVVQKRERKKPVHDVTTKTETKTKTDKETGE